MFFTWGIICTIFSDQDTFLDQFDKPLLSIYQTHFTNKLILAWDKRLGQMRVI